MANNNTNNGISSEAVILTIVSLTVGGVTYALTESVFLSAIVGVFSALISIVATTSIKDKIEADKIAKANKPYNDFMKENKPYIDFYNKCVEHGIKEEKDFNKKAASEKAELIVEQFFADRKKELSSSEGMKKAFLKGQAAVKKLDDDKQKKADEKNKAELEKKKKAEREEYQKNMKYDNLPGKQKLIAELTDLSKEYRSKESGYENLRQYALSGGRQEKEHSSSIAGGIANGLAGPAAGLMTALDVEQKNAEIRARNAERTETFIKAGLSMGKNPYSYDASRYASFLREAEKKLVGKNPSAELFKALKFDDVKYTVTECGSVKITGKISTKGKVLITSDTEGFIDGYIKAVVYEGKTRLGDGKVILPLFGAKMQQEFSGTVLFCAEPGKKSTYRIEFEDYQLCAIEE